MNDIARIPIVPVDIPEFVQCRLCLLPRTAGARICPYCRHEDAGEALGNVPEDFALRLAAEGRWDSAAAFLEGEVASGRETAGGSLLLAWIALINNDLRAVEVWCHESLRLAPGSPEPHLLLGLVLERSHRWEEAVAELTLALAAPLPDGRRALISERKSHSKSQIPEW